MLQREVQLDQAGHGTHETSVTVYRKDKSKCRDQYSESRLMAESKKGEGVVGNIKKGQQVPALCWAPAGHMAPARRSQLGGLSGPKLPSSLGRSHRCHASPTQRWSTPRSATTTSSNPIETKHLEDLQTSQDTAGNSLTRAVLPPLPLH